VFAALALVSGLAAWSAPTILADKADDSISVPAHSTVFVGSDGTPTVVDRLQNVAVYGTTRTQICEIVKSWNDFNGTHRTMSGNVVVRVAWMHDQRSSGSDDDVDWIDWGYNWPGTGAGQGTGLSFENNTNYVLRIDKIDYRNIASGEIAAAWSPIGDNTGIANGERVHVWGEGSINNINTWEQWHAHSYWHNAPRVRMFFSSANWDFNYESQSVCSAYVPGQPSA
jgi:hypothetical protein